MLTLLSDPTNAQRFSLCLRSLSVEICKTPTTCLNGRELNYLCSNGRDSIVCLHGPMSTFNCIFRLQLLNTMVLTQLLTIMVGPQLRLSAIKSDNQSDSFSKSSNSQDHRFLAWRHSHTRPIFYLGFIMTIAIVISFARECELYPKLCTWTKSRIVQSPTKLNDKI